MLVSWGIFLYAYHSDLSPVLAMSLVFWVINYMYFCSGARSFRMEESAPLTKTVMLPSNSTAILILFRSESNSTIFNILNLYSLPLYITVVTLFSVLINSNPIFLAAFRSATSSGDGPWNDYYSACDDIYYSSAFFFLLFYFLFRLNTEDFLDCFRH